jgi:hypothetical protein
MAVIDDDLVRAELALTELRRVRTLPFERSLAIIRLTTRNNGSRTQNIETAQADARLAISSLRFQSAIAKSESVASFSALFMQQHNLPCPRRVPRSSAHDPATVAA